MSSGRQWALFSAIVVPWYLARAFVPAVDPVLIGVVAMYVVILRDRAGPPRPLRRPSDDRRQP